MTTTREPTDPLLPRPSQFRPFYVLPGTRIGSYVVRDAIGEGGGQVVYLAEDPDGQKVVLKMSRFPRSLKGTWASSMHERFLRQVAFFLQLRGISGVAQIFAHGAYPNTSGRGHSYLVQEWIPGSVNILDWYRNEPHPLEAIVLGFSILANACGEMDRRGICNRDLKPDNILVTPQGVPKVVDFDSGMAVGAEKLTTTGPGRWPGTKLYYSPEVCEAILADWPTGARTPFEYRPPADLHALGVIFYEVLTGEYPFDASAGSEELYKQIARKVPRRPRWLNPKVPWGLDKITMRLLQKEPAKRYQSGDDLVAELEVLLMTAEDWSRPFQTPVGERHSTSTTSRPRSIRTGTGTPGTPPPTPRPRATVGSAALSLAPSAIVLAGPRALLRPMPGPFPLVVIPRPAKVASAEPETQPAGPRRHARLLASALALGLVLVVPGLFLGQYGAGSFLQRGAMLLGKAKAAVVAGASAVLAACTGITGNVRADDKDWLAKCPPEYREEVRKLALADVGLAEIMEGPNVIIPDDGGVELRDGPVVVDMSFASARGSVGGWLYGEIRTGSDGASLRFTKLKLFDGSEVVDPEDRTATIPAGRELSVCAIASERRYGPDHPGIRKVTRPRRPSELHPGYMLLTTGALEIHFAR